MLLDEVLEYLGLPRCPCMSEVKYAYNYLYKLSEGDLPDEQRGMVEQYLEELGAYLNHLYEEESFEEESFEDE